MLRALLSDDLPNSRLLSALLLAILLLLALAPLLFSGAQAINTAAKICVFIVLVASYDLLLGYTGIVSFAHTMFYGIGGYGVGLALYGWGARLGCRRRRTRRRLPQRHRLGLGDRSLLLACAGDLLCHDHAGGGIRLRHSGRPAFRIHRGRGWPFVSGARAAAPRPMS
jgi:hypothetical protein